MTHLPETQKRNALEEPRCIRSISVESWHRLSLDGCSVPIAICLNGDSMRPLIRRNRDAVTIIPLRRPVKRGDIVLFADGDGRYVVHRVWKRGEDTILTMGDHCTKPDRPLYPNQIWGLVTKVQRGSKSIPLDTRGARCLGCIWMGLLPIRILYYNMKNRGEKHGTQ